MQTRQLWYTRRGNEVRGPFPAKQISRYILLGRIRESDELSVDQHVWQRVSEVPVLVPEEMKADLHDTEAYERLMVARMREDERSARDRRAEEGETASATPLERRRSDDDRRSWEELELVRHREIKTAISEASRVKKQHYFLRGMVATLVVVGLVGSALYYRPWTEGESADCNAIPQPWVNWSNCLMDGARLISVDLRGARLRNTNFAGADLRGSQLAGADLAYANLVGANLTGTRLEQAALVGSNLRNASLAGAHLAGANMAYAILQGTDLSGADLSQTDLTNADLRGAKLDATQFAKAKLDNALWVDGLQCGAGSIGECRNGMPTP